jgi:hypothetical protein
MSTVKAEHSNATTRPPLPVDSQFTFEREVLALFDGLGVARVCGLRTETGQPTRKCSSVT